MLAIRLQRLGRKGHPVYRVAVQEAQRHPSSGRVVAYVGTYDPHTKNTTFNAEKVEFYLKNGAQPSPRVVKLLEDQKVKLPDWVTKSRTDKVAKIRKPEKLRKNQPKEETTSVEAEAKPEEAEQPAEESAEKTEE